MMVTIVITTDLGVSIKCWDNELVVNFMGIQWLISWESSGYGATRLQLDGLKMLGKSQSKLWMTGGTLVT